MVTNHPSRDPRKHGWYGKIFSEMEIKPARIIWHHSADNSDDAQFHKINVYHKSLNFPLSALGYYVGYHYLIEANGAVIQARKETEIGAHDQGENSNSLGICLAGNFNIRYPSEAQSASAALLIKQIRTRWPIPVTRIEPHRWDDTTDCPGTLVADNFLINEFLKREGSVFARYFYEVGKYLKLL